MCRVLSVKDRMESSSPTASASTNRGGRPKEWTVARIRRYIRLYLFTALPREDILRLLEEDEFKPGKDAANKVKNSVLGNDPRWLRPKSEEEEKNRIRGLRNSRYVRRCRRGSASLNVKGELTEQLNAAPYGAFLETESLGGTTIAGSYRSSSEMFTATPDEIDPNASPLIHDSTGPFKVSRHGTGLTTSTNSSISSAWKEKLKFLPYNKVKQTFTILKRYTFPRDLDSQHISNVASSPLRSPATIEGINDPANATYIVPGDFLNDELLHLGRACAADSPAHLAGGCWCKVAEQVSTISPWDTFTIPFHISDPSLVMKDLFGNTMFHRLAAMDGIQDLFLNLVSQALHDPGLPLRDSNTAGQTLLHVLHRSWFQQGSKLDDLLNELRNGGFNLFATDVYGRTFFHLLQTNGGSVVRYLGQASDSRTNRRDAFGVRPLDIQSSHNTGHYCTHNEARLGVRMSSSGLLPMINTHTETAPEHDYSAHANLLITIRRALEFEDSGIANAQLEDSQGRNAFHALAEVSFGLSQGTPKHRTRGHLKDKTRSSPNGHSKRKHTEDEEIETPRTAREGPRLVYLGSLIDARVDANHYDKRGNTPLMSFVMNSSDATKCDKEETEAIIRSLVREAGANMELRNRDGETALHLAARYSKIIALRVLLELGANPHTRNNQGLDILQVVDRLYLATEHDDKNNARYQACFAMLTGITEYAGHGPTVYQEWGMKHE